MANIIWAAIAWVTRGVFIALMVGAIYYAIFAVLVPVIWYYAADYFNLSGLTSLLNTLPDSLYWGLYVFRLDLALPWCLTAFAVRFIIRRIR